VPKDTKDEDKSAIERDLEEALRGEEPREDSQSDKGAEFEKELDSEIKGEEPQGGTEPNPFAVRFYELSGKPFKTETELDNAVNGILNEMERDYFFRGLLKTKKAGKQLLMRGLEVVKGATAYQAAKDITQLTRGNLKGTLSTLAKSALKVVREGAAVSPVLSDLGFEPRAGTERSREAWQTFASLCEESFDYLALNLNEDADDPIEAGRLAFKAFGAALKKVKSERKSAPVQTTRRVGEEAIQRKVDGRKIVIVLGLVSIILAASLVTAVAFYLPAANTINSLRAEMAAKDDNMTALVQENLGLQNALNQISAQLSGKDSQITDLNNTLQGYIVALQGYQNIVFLNASGFLANNQGLTINPNANLTLWNDVLEYAGYVTVQVQSSSNTTYAQVLYSTVSGVNFDQTVVLGTAGATAFPVLPGQVEIRIGDTEPVDSVTATVTAVYHY
jgi:hypothetical protein